MTFFRIVFFSLIAATLSACGPKLNELPATNFAPYVVDARTVGDTATIKGTYTPNTGVLGIGSEGAYVAAIDGKVAFHRTKRSDPLTLAPGPHALALSYWQGTLEGFAPAYFDAKPGASYVIKFESGDYLFFKERRSYSLYVVEEKSGEVVVPKTPDHFQDATERYVEPVGTELASIRGTSDESLLNVDAAFVLAIDNRYVALRPETALTSALPDYSGTFKLTPGLHAIFIGAQLGTGSGIFPVLLDAKPGASYVARYESGLKRHGASKWQTFTVWLEEEKTGAIVVPKTDLAVTKLAF